MRQLFRLSIFIFSQALCSCNTIDKGFEIYLVKKDHPGHTTKESTNCDHCFKPTTKDLFDEPLLTRSDIEYFDWDHQRIELTSAGFRKITKLNIPLQGQAAAIVVDGQPIYGFWFWNTLSSFGCDHVCTIPELGFKLEFGLPHGNANGRDPRFDSRLRECLIKNELIK